jgi:hypothetical protein
MFGSNGSEVSGTATTCLSLNSVSTPNECEAVGASTGPFRSRNLTWGPVPPTGLTISNLSALASTAVAAGGRATITVLVNNVAKELSCEIPAGSTTCTDTTHTVSVPAGAFLQVQVASVGAGSLAYVATFNAS